MKIHFIAIGGSAMHNLALALQKEGHEVTGSDDEIFEPSRSRLAAKGILPPAYGWFPEKIHAGLDAVIVGMHARNDNPELSRTKELGLPFFSYPEFLYEQTKNKTRIVIGGSHGKTTVTSMIMHVMKHAGIDFDYMVGSLIEGFDNMVNFSTTSKYAVFEGDEYLSSPTDLRPKFHLYMPHVAVITGIAWDHVNVFPTFENYVEQFKIFCDKIEPSGSLIYFGGDAEVQKLAGTCRRDVNTQVYEAHPYTVRDNATFLNTSAGEIPVLVFGEHNMQNLQAALLVCRQVGVSDTDFYKHISYFSGAAKRLQKLKSSQNLELYLDFAHSPSKLKATIEAVKKQHSGHKLLACFELHTFSSLSESFLPQYAHCMDVADEAAVFVNPHAFEMKRMTPFTPEQIREGFARNNITVFFDEKEIEVWLQTYAGAKNCVLMMSSGNFNGLNLTNLNINS
ncbi:MAG: peptidoglycan synthetase [Bacteroidetes bacterium HGW-Bacteroidetes-21]|nr:MAG: peptidoglycan synthetase [Bacteroidetes bacterium HGW-Bacteroidetes-21]